jgi:glyoxylase-like metal-dependent hydrolase (beta-lactamase superfamily II)
VFFRQILNEDLSCASYIIADSGEAAAVDPKWEIEDYLRIAEENNFRISHILETHNHADHLSGRGRLEEATGALLYVSKTRALNMSTWRSPTAMWSRWEACASSPSPLPATAPSTPASW